MATVDIVYEGELRTIATHAGSGAVLITDAPLDNQGKGQAFSPTDLLVTSLGSCMLTIIGIAAREHKFSIDGVKISMQKIMIPSPRKVGEIKIHFDFSANKYSEREKKIIENSAKTCPVYLSLHPDLKKTIAFSYRAAE